MTIQPTFSHTLENKGSNTSHLDFPLQTLFSAHLTPNPDNIDCVLLKMTLLNVSLQNRHSAWPWRPKNTRWMVFWSALLYLYKLLFKYFVLLICILCKCILNITIFICKWCAIWPVGHDTLWNKMKQWNNVALIIFEQTFLIFFSYLLIPPIWSCWIVSNTVKKCHNSRHSKFSPVLQILLWAHAVVLYSL